MTLSPDAAGNLVAIIALTARCANAVDLRRWDELTGCFASDAVAVYAGTPPLEGADEIVRFLRESNEPLTATQHLVSNHAVTLRETEAECEYQVMAQHVLKGTPGGNTCMTGMVYRESYRRAPEDSWRVVHRSARPLWWDGNVAVLRRGNKEGSSSS